MTPVQQIRQHALENYDNGWDYIVECYTDDEIQSEYLDECNGDLEAALKLIESVASIRKDRQEEAQQYIEENKDTQPTEQHNMTDNFYREVIADTIWYAEKYKMTFKEALDDWEGDGPDGSWGLTNQEKTEILECYRETKQTH